MAKKKYTAAERENMARRTNKRKDREREPIPQDIIYDDEIQPRRSANLEYSHSKGGADTWEWFLAFTVVMGALIWFL